MGSGKGTAKRVNTTDNNAVDYEQLTKFKIKNLNTEELKKKSVRISEYAHIASLDKKDKTLTSSYAKHYLGAKKEKYTPEEISYALTQLLTDIVNANGIRESRYLGKNRWILDNDFNKKETKLLNTIPNHLEIFCKLDPGRDTDTYYLVEKTNRTVLSSIQFWNQMPKIGLASNGRHLNARQSTITDQDNVSAFDHVVTARYIVNALLNNIHRFSDRKMSH